MRASPSKQAIQRSPVEEDVSTVKVDTSEFDGCWLVTKQLLALYLRYVPTISKADRKRYEYIQPGRAHRMRYLPAVLLPLCSSIMLPTHILGRAST